MTWRVRRLTRGKNLIVRVLKGRVNPELVVAFRVQAQEVIRDLRTHDGLVHTEVGRQVHSDGGEEIILVSIWRDLSSIYNWLGVADLLDTPMVNRGEPNLFEHFEVQHYEVLDGDSATVGSAEEVGWAAAERQISAARALEFGA
jgi:heme-degrading monooxygenase HmoA